MSRDKILMSSTNCAFEFSSEELPMYQETTLNVLFIAFGALSMSACLYVIVGFLMLKNRPNFLSTSSMILYLALSDFFLSIDYVLDGVSPIFQESFCRKDLCLIKATFSQFFSLTSFSWNASLSHSSYNIVKPLFRTWGGAPTRGVSTVYSMWFYHLFSWGISLLLTATTFLTAATEDERTCWVLNQQAWAKIVLYLIPLVLFEIYNIYVCVILVRALVNIPVTLGGDHLLRKLNWYLLIIVWTRALCLLNRAQILFSHQSSSAQMFAMLLLSALGAPLQGLGDALIFRSGRGDVEVNDCGGIAVGTQDGNDPSVGAVLNQGESMEPLRRSGRGKKNNTFSFFKGLTRYNIYFRLPASSIRRNSNTNVFKFETMGPLVGAQDNDANAVSNMDTVMNPMLQKGLEEGSRGGVVDGDNHVRESPLQTYRMVRSLSGGDDEGDGGKGGGEEQGRADEGELLGSELTNDLHGLGGREL